MDKWWCFHKTQYYTATKKNKLGVHTTMWVNLTGVMLSDKCDLTGMKVKSRQNESVFIRAEWRLLLGEMHIGKVRDRSP